MSGSSRRSRPASPSPSPVRYASRAERDVDALRNYYKEQRRIEAVRNLDRALDEAEARIGRDPKAGLPAPRPYPHMARQGVAWIKTGRYWIAYSPGKPPVILAVFHEAADIPGRY